jgi:hypothetical protein
MSGARFIGQILFFDDNLSWNNKYGKKIVFDGSTCLPFSLDLEATTQLSQINHRKLSDCSDFFKSFISTRPKLPVTDSFYARKVEELMLLPLSDDVQAIGPNEKIKCEICDKMVKFANMRVHIAVHFAKEEIEKDEHLCGYCGQIGCSIAIVKTSGNGVRATFGPQSDCLLFREFSLKPAEGSKICTNRPINCEICNAVFWSYNLEQHYFNKHKDQAFISKITTEEIRVLSNKRI